ncbi:MULTISPECIES: helix-turn-helix domain-containing protein [Micrococcaceae]|uniref:helix-turn-helix domain-containing protein n=1 Tax=Micrococcaceae TaxID=1268 RepID=UPI000AF0A7A2|nr:helix-turn-helix domain-containing protein [Arthrobacter sp. Soil761]
MKVLEGAAAGEHTERNVILDIAHALAEDHRRSDVDRKPKNVPESVRMLGKVGGRPLVIDADKRAAILAKLEKGDSMHVIARELHVPVESVYNVLVQQAAAAAIALRPIPPEAIRSGAIVAASIAEKRARRYRTCVQCGGDCEPGLNWADDLGIRMVYVCPQHGAQSVVDPIEDRS